MNGKGVLIIALVSVALISVAGVGFAVTYTATTISSDNTMSYSGNTVEIVDFYGEPVTSSLTIASPTRSINDNIVTVNRSTTTISEYQLKVSTEGEDLTVRCWVKLADARSWVIVESMTLTIDGHTVNFLNNGVSSVPSDSILLTKGLHSFTFSITYANVSIDLSESEDTGFLNFSNARLMFIAGDSDPLSVSNS